MVFDTAVTLSATGLFAFSMRRSVASLLPSSCFTAAAGVWRTLHLAHASPLRDVGEGLVRGSIGRITPFRVFFFDLASDAGLTFLEITEDAIRVPSPTEVEVIL